MAVSSAAGTNWAGNSGTPPPVEEVDAAGPVLVETEVVEPLAGVPVAADSLTAKTWPVVVPFSGAMM